jgi:hypothetical protein
MDFGRPLGRPGSDLSPPLHPPESPLRGPSEVAGRLRTASASVCCPPGRILLRWSKLPGRARGDRVRSVRQDGPNTCRTDRPERISRKAATTSATITGSCSWPQWARRSPRTDAASCPGRAAQTGLIPSPEGNSDGSGRPSPRGTKSGPGPGNSKVFDPARGLGKAICSATSIPHDTGDGPKSAGRASARTPSLATAQTARWRGSITLTSSIRVESPDGGR